MGRTGVVSTVGLGFDTLSTMVLVMLPETGLVRVSFRMSDDRVLLACQSSIPVQFHK